MGVYIDMEMPKNCQECPLEQPYDGYNCAINEKSYSWGLSGRPSDCPLIPVPPHGDLIDKDATMNAILEERGEDTACWFACIVNDMPVVIPSDKAEEGET